jgi:hypothetical protein
MVEEKRRAITIDALEEFIRRIRKAAANAAMTERKAR